MARTIGASVNADGSVRTYTIAGQVFFASSEAFSELFDFNEEDIESVHIDVTAAHFWDLTAVGALDKVVFKFRKAGKRVEVVGLNEASATLVDRLGTHHREGTEAMAAGH